VTVKLQPFAQFFNQEGKDVPIKNALLI